MSYKWHICSFHSADGEVKDGRRTWRFEFSEMFGPTVVDKRGVPLRNQPSERSQFWPAFNKWHEDYKAKKESGNG